jgi:hypothetical protein
MLHSDMMSRMSIREFDDWAAFHLLQLEQPVTEGIQRPPEEILHMLHRADKRERRAHK